MEPHLHVLTLGVADKPRAIRFYRDGLGLPTASKDEDDVAFFQLGPLIFALWGYDQLIGDANLPSSPKPPFSGTALAQCLPSKADVDAALARAEAAGATITKPAHDTFWGGYSGYFTDPEGYAWEIAWNPAWTLTPDGGIKLPETS